VRLLALEKTILGRLCQHSFGKATLTGCVFLPRGQPPLKGCVFVPSGAACVEGSVFLLGESNPWLEQSESPDGIEAPEEEVASFSEMKTRF